MTSFHWNEEGFRSELIAMVHVSVERNPVHLAIYNIEMHFDTSAIHTFKQIIEKGEHIHCKQFKSHGFQFYSILTLPYFSSCEEMRITVDVYSIIMQT